MILYILIIISLVKKCKRNAMLTQISTKKQNKKKKERTGNPTNPPNHPPFSSTFSTLLEKGSCLLAYPSLTRYYSLNSPSLHSLRPWLSIFLLKSSFLFFFFSNLIFWSKLFLSLFFRVKGRVKGRDVCGAATPAIGSGFHRRRGG